MCLMTQTRSPRTAVCLTVTARCEMIGFHRNVPVHPLGERKIPRLGRVQDLQVLENHIERSPQSQDDLDHHGGVPPCQQISESNASTIL